MIRNSLCISLEPNEVHLWFIDPQNVVNTNLLDKYMEALSTEEKRCFAELKSTKRQLQFVITRAALRFIVVQYQPITINDIQFSRSEFGKPFLKFPDATLHYNLSHSSDKIVIAFTRVGDIGVDIEQMKKSRDMAKIAQYYYHPKEQSFVNNRDNQQTLYKLWTLKEAYTKATGEGLRTPFQQFYFDFHQHETPRIVLPQGETEPSQNWFFQHWFLKPNYSLAIALKKTSDTNTINNIKVCARDYIPLQCSSSIALSSMIIP